MTVFAGETHTSICTLTNHRAGILREQCRYGETEPVQLSLLGSSRVRSPFLSMFKRLLQHPLEHW